MDKSLKAALLSGLVLPGLGQFFLKRYKRGAALVLVVLGSMFVIISKALEQAQCQEASLLVSYGKMASGPAITGNVMATVIATAIARTSTAFRLFLICPPPFARR